MKIFIPGSEDRFQNYSRAILAAGGVPCFSPERSESCGALLLPGGGDLEPWRYGQENTVSRNLDPSRDAAELALLERFAAEGKPVLGVCRGLQVINVFFSGTLCQDLPGHAADPGGRDTLHPVRTAPSLLRRLFGVETVVNSAHHQAVDRLGEGLIPVQWAPDGTVEALVHRELPILGVQWHPERTGPGAADGLLLFRALCAREAALSGKRLEESWISP